MRKREISKASIQFSPVTSWDPTLPLPWPWLVLFTSTNPPREVEADNEKGVFLSPRPDLGAKDIASAPPGGAHSLMASTELYLKWGSSEAEPTTSTHLGSDSRPQGGNRKEQGRREASVRRVVQVTAVGNRSSSETSNKSQHVFQKTSILRRESVSPTPISRGLQDTPRAINSLALLTKPAA